MDPQSRLSSHSLLHIANTLTGKDLRMSNDAEGAINILQKAMRPERPHHFVQADMVVSNHFFISCLAGADAC